MAGHPRFRELTEYEVELHDSKSGDYASGGGNPLGNFERVARILSNYPKLDLSKPEVVAMVYLLKQLDAVANMIANDCEGGVETIERRLLDISVYAKLMIILHEEAKCIK